jgi:acyl dehydratase
MELTIAQIAAAENLDLGHSRWLTVDQARIDAFGTATEDLQWIHNDPERAKDSRFGGTIAHGFLLISLIPTLFYDIFSAPEAEMLVNYGLEKVRFIAPVPSGSEIRLEARLVGAVKQRSGYLMRLRGDLIIKASGRRALASENLFLVVPKAT